MLEDDLESDWQIRILFDGLENFPEFTTADRLDAIEIVDRPALLLFLLLLILHHDLIKNRL